MICDCCKLKFPPRQLTWAVTGQKGVQSIRVCPSCIEDFSVCSVCLNPYPKNEYLDGLCPECRVFFKKAE